MSLVAQHFSELYMHDVRLLGICTISLNFLSTLQWQIQGRAWGPPPPPYFLTKLRGQTEGHKKNDFFLPPPPILSQGLDDWVPPYLMV